jgi:hypothetical protein
VGGVDGEVDYVVVDEDGEEIELLAEVVGLEETVIDEDVAGDLPDAGGGNLLGQISVPGEWIGFGEVGVAERVGFVVVEVSEGYGAVGVGAATHGEVACGDEDEVAMKCTGGGDVAATVDGGVVGVGGTDFVHEFADGEDLADRADEKLMRGFGVDDGLAGGEVDDAKTPSGVFVGGLVEDGFDARGEGWCGGGLCGTAADG